MITIATEIKHCTQSGNVGLTFKRRNQREQNTTATQIVAGGSGIEIGDRRGCPNHPE